jgi:hypothetical protein
MSHAWWPHKGVLRLVLSSLSEFGCLDLCVYYISASLFSHLSPQVSAMSGARGPGLGRGRRQAALAGTRGGSSWPGCASRQGTDALARRLCCCKRGGARSSRVSLQEALQANREQRHGAVQDRGREIAEGLMGESLADELALTGLAFQSAYSTCRLICGAPLLIALGQGPQGIGSFVINSLAYRVAEPPAYPREASDK